MRRFLAVIIPLVTVFVFTASALAISLSQADAKTKSITRSEAACGQGYWHCGNPSADCIPIGANGSDVSHYDCTGDVQRYGPAHGNAHEVCYVTMWLEQRTGAVIYGPHIHCTSLN